MPDPYTPPVATLDGAPMNGKKPIAMWLLQIVCVLSVPVLLLYALLLALYSLDDKGDNNSGIVAALVFVFGLLPWAVATLVTIQRRSAASRWLGGSMIGLFVFICALPVISELTRDLHSGSSRSSAMVGYGMIVAAEVYWLYAFAFSPKAKRYLGLKEN